MPFERPPLWARLEILLLRRPDFFEKSTAFWAAVFMAAALGGASIFSSFPLSVKVLLWVPVLAYGVSWSYVQFTSRDARLGRVAGRFLKMLHDGDHGYMLGLIESGSTEAVERELTSGYGTWHAEGLAHIVIAEPEDTPSQERGPRPKPPR